VPYDSPLVDSFSGVDVTPVCGRAVARCDDFKWFDLRFFVLFWLLFPTNTKRKALNPELRAAIIAEVNLKILPKLHQRCEAILGKHGWQLTPSKEQNEEMALLFLYPNAFEYSSYLRPQIKIEFGRGDQQPSEKSSVTSFVGETFPDIFREKSASILVLDCERTFWEKVTLLHAENHRPDPSTLKPWMARHWSDIAVMSTAARFRDENLSRDLLSQVIVFKKIYFGANWAQYDTAVPGTLRIMPNEALLTILRKDYQTNGGNVSEQTPDFR